MKRNEVDFRLDEQEIGDYIYEELVAEGFVPESEEIEVISAIVFDYIMQFLEDNGIIGEIIHLHDEDDE